MIMSDEMMTTPPHDRMAEQALLGRCMSAGKIPEDAEQVEPLWFYEPAHELIWLAMMKLSKAGLPCDAVAVNAKLDDAKLLPKIGGSVYLVNLLEGTSAAHGGISYLVEIIRDRAMRRRIIDVASRLTQAAWDHSGWEQIVEQGEAELNKLNRFDHEQDNLISLQTISEFLGLIIPEPDWILPGYICRDERLMITAAEGLGKSTLMRQLAMCAAAGMDPFNGQKREAMTALVIDVENPLHIMQKRFNELRKAISAHGETIQEGRFWIDRRPAGLDLGTAEDRRWLRKRVLATNPDLLLIGPAYKLFTGSSEDKDEVLARTVSSVLDDLRTEANCSLILEAHPGNEVNGAKRNLRPFGSSLWRRWTDFGYGLRATGGADGKARRLVELEEWKGPRDPRDWPEAMESGGDEMPWVEAVLPAA
jgi:hypothetical protein